MTRVTFLRHGETLWNREGRMQGATDVGLSERGRSQAARAAVAWEGVEFDEIWSSPLQRALDTARAVAGERPVHTDPRLAETDVGSWAGRTAAEVATEMPDQADRYHAGIDYRRSSTGETAAEVAERGAACVEELAGRWPEGHLLVATHGYFTQLVVSRLLGLDGFGNRLGVLGNTGAAVVQRSRGRWSLVAYNLLGPLPGMSVSPIRHAP